MLDKIAIYKEKILKIARDLSYKEKKSLSPNEYGIPEQKRYPMPDKAHVVKAWQMVNKGKNIPNKEALKSRIKSRAKALGVDTSNWSDI